MKNNNFLKVYISALPSVYEGKALYPKERQNEIERTKNPEQKKQKYFAWQLLQYAFSHSSPSVIRTNPEQSQPSVYLQFFPLKSSCLCTFRFGYSSAIFPKRKRRLRVRMKVSRIIPLPPPIIYRRGQRASSILFIRKPTVSER